MSARSSTTPVDAFDHGMVDGNSCHLRKVVWMWMIESFNRKEGAANGVEEAREWLEAILKT